MAASSDIHLVGSNWEFEPLQLPESEDVFSKLRTAADEIFDFKDMDDWLEKQVEPHVLEVGHMGVSREMTALEQKKEQEDDERDEKWNEEIAERVEEAREEVTEYQEGLRESNTKVEWRLREEEVAARERLVYEHQAMEAQLLSKVYTQNGLLQNVASDPFSWSVEWRKAPQEFEVNVTALRGCRAKLRDGYYVILISVYDRVGGKCLRFSTGEKNLDCNEALPPLRMKAKSGQVDRFINKSVNMLCPAPEILQTYAALVVEVWQLKVGKYDPVDKVVGWGVWPLVNKDFRVVEGKFKIPIMKGEVNPETDTYRSITTSIQQNLTYWLGNLYFEIKSRRAKHDEKAALEASVKISEEEGIDALRLTKTVDDHNHLVVAKLPPRLFFDDVALGNHTASQGLRRRYFGSADMRPLNAALWEKRSLLEKEKTSLRTEFVRKKTRTFMGEDDDDDVQDARIRADLDMRKSTVRRLNETKFAAEEEQGKARDSHSILGNHHIALASQREFVFLGRRYRDRAQIASSVVKYDLGINHGGPWDKTKVVTNVIFFVLGLFARMIVHNVGLSLYLSFLDVPLTKNEWGVFAVDIRFEHTTRFSPTDTLVTSMIGFAVCILFFMFLGITLYLLLLVFEHIPYAITRFAMWYGVAVFLDPIITIISEALLGDFDSGDPFIFGNQMQREEGNALSGVTITLALYIGMMFIQFVLVYWFACVCHLNGRVNDVYDRILFPENSFFVPHDLEVSQFELFDVVKRAKNWRSEAGDVKKVRVHEFNHRQTCFFRARLFRLLSIMSDNADEWVPQYIEGIPLRRPLYAKKLIEHNLGKYALGSDIADFVKRAFPHLTFMSDNRVGDSHEDSYYEGETIRQIQVHSTANEDDAEMRTILKAYFTAQVFSEKPAAWDRDEDDTFIIKDRQLLADLIFFETSNPTMRMFNLALYLRKYTESFFSIDPDDPESHSKCKLPEFIRTDHRLSVSGKETEGSIVHIILLNPAKGTRQLARAFVITPFGFIIEPTSTSFTYLAHHTADNAEFWAAKAVQMGKELDEQFVKS